MLHSAPSIHEKELYTYRRRQSPTTLRDRAVKAKRSTKADKWDPDSVDDDTLSKWLVQFISHLYIYFFFRFVFCSFFVRILFVSCSFSDYDCTRVDKIIYFYF